MLKSTESQRVGHNLATEQQDYYFNIFWQQLNKSRDFEVESCGWEWGSRGRDYIYIQLTHFVVLQKLTHCKAIILQ